LIYPVHDLLISPSVGGVELVEYVCTHPCLINCVFRGGSRLRSRRRLRTVMMALSRLSHRPRCSRPLLRPRRHDSSNRSDGTPKATTATITNKSSRVSLQLTHELGGYIRRMRSRAPTENYKNVSNSKTHRLSLSVTLQLPLRLGGYRRGPGLGAPFDGKIISLEDNKTIIHKVKTSVSRRAA
jgi:hypothetical protein